MTKCCCGIPDWRELRKALGLTQWQMSGLMKVGVRQVVRWENADHHICPRLSSITHLRRMLRRPEYQERLEEAGYSYPFAKERQKVT